MKELLKFDDWGCRRYVDWTDLPLETVTAGVSHRMSGAGNSAGGGLMAGNENYSLTGSAEVSYDIASAYAFSRAFRRHHYRGAWRPVESDSGGGYQNEPVAPYASFVLHRPACRCAGYSPMIDITLPLHPPVLDNSPDQRFKLPCSAHLSYAAKCESVFTWLNGDDTTPASRWHSFSSACSLSALGVGRNGFVSLSLRQLGRRRFSALIRVSFPAPGAWLREDGNCTTEHARSENDSDVGVCENFNPPYHDTYPSLLLPPGVSGLCLDTGDHHPDGVESRSLPEFVRDHVLGAHTAEFVIPGEEHQWQWRDATPHFTKVKGKNAHISTITVSIA